MKLGLASKLFLIILTTVAGSLVYTAYLSESLKRLDGYQALQMHITEIMLLRDRINLDMNQRYLFFGMYQATKLPQFKEKLLIGEHDLQSSIKTLTELCRDDPKKLTDLSEARTFDQQRFVNAMSVLGGAKQTRISDLLGGGPIAIGGLRWMLNSDLKNVFELGLDSDEGRLAEAEKQTEASEHHIFAALIVGLLATAVAYLGLVQWFKHSISSRLNTIVNNIGKIMLGKSDFEQSSGSDELDSLNMGIIESAKKIREGEASKAQTVKLIAEELEYPLKAIGVSLQDFRQHGLIVYSQQADERIEKATAEINRLRELVDELTHIDEIQSTHVEMEILPFDLADLSAAAVSVVQEFAISRKVTIELENQPAPVIGDWQKVLQVTINLLSNAIKFSPPESAVKVSTSTEQNQGILSVSDAGKGISDEFKTKIFSRFEQSANTASGGSGLGLAICKDLLEAQSGQLKFKSPADSGRGTTFWLTLPLNADQQKATQQNTTATAPAPETKSVWENKGYRQTLWLRGAMLLSLPFMMQVAMIIVLCAAFNSLHMTSAKLVRLRRIASAHSEMFSHFSRGVLWAMVYNVARDKESRRSTMAEQDVWKKLVAELKELTGSDAQSSKDFAITETMIKVGIKIQDDLMKAPMDCDSDPWFGPEHIHETASLPAQMESPLLDTINRERNLILQDVEEEHAIRSFIENTLVISAVLTACTSLLLSVFLLRRWTKRIRPILINVDCLARGEELVNLVFGDDELAYIDRSLHAVSAKKAELEKFKSELLSVTSHELRTPLTSLAVLADLLENGVFGELTENGVRVLKFTQLQMDNLISLITDLLDLEKMRSGKRLINREPAKLAEIMTGVIETTRNQAARRNITVQVVSSSATLDADCKRIIQALSAVVRHCLNTIPEYAAVTLTSECDNNFATLRIETPSLGDASDKLNIFMARHSARQELVEDLARCIAEQHDGTFTIARSITRCLYTMHLPR